MSFALRFQGEESDRVRLFQRLAPPTVRDPKSANPQNGGRFEQAASGSSGCVPIVRIRRDLVDPKRPNEVQLLTLFLPEAPCGEQWAGKAVPQSNRCDFAVPLMRELDWTAVRAVVGW